MPAPQKTKSGLSRKERWLLILGLLALAAFIALSIWAALSIDYSEHWPPPTID